MLAELTDDLGEPGVLLGHHTNLTSLLTDRNIGIRQVASDNTNKIGTVLSLRPLNGIDGYR